MWSEVKRSCRSTLSLARSESELDVRPLTPLAYDATFFESRDFKISDCLVGFTCSYGTPTHETPGAPDGEHANAESKRAHGVGDE